MDERAKSGIPPRILALNYAFEVHRDLYFTNGTETTTGFEPAFRWASPWRIQLPMLSYKMADSEGVAPSSSGSKAEVIALIRTV